MNEQDKQFVIQTIKKYNKSNAFSGRKLTDTPTDQFSVVNKKYVDDSIANALKTVSIVADSRDISLADGLQTITHGLGSVPRRIRVIATLNGVSKSEGQYWDGGLNGSAPPATYAGYVLGVLTDGTVFNGTFGFTPPNDPPVGCDLMWGGADMSNRNVGGFYSLDATNLVITWNKVGSPTGVFRFIIEFEK